MRKALIALGIFVLCLPLLFSLWLLAAVQSPKLDGTTQGAPDSIREFVASVAMSKAAYDKESLPIVDRVLRLDPKNKAAISRRCSIANAADLPTKMADCTAALNVTHDAEAYFNVGKIQLAQGNYCEAENNLTEAASHASGSNNAGYLNRMGVAAIRCNDLPGGRAALEAALDQDQKSVAEPNQDQDELEAERADLLNDQELLLIVYKQQHLSDLETKMCKDAHHTASHCNCSLDKNNAPVCGD